MPAEQREALVSQGETLNVFVLMPSGGHGEYPRGVDEAEFLYDKIIYPAIVRAGTN